MVLNDRFKAQTEGFSPADDTSASISLLSYSPNKLVYASSASAPHLAVFSEIYYPEGWHVSIDGNKAEYFQTDFLLRGMLIPAGNHKIEFVFKPRAYYTGNKIAYAGSGILLLLLLGTLYNEIRKFLNKNKDV